METPVQCVVRTLRALNELIDREGMYLRGGECDLAAEMRLRADPLVQQLVDLAGSPGVSDFGPQVEALLRRNHRHSALLQQKMEELRAELIRAHQARHRATQFAPVYAQAPEAVTPRFLAAG